MEVLCCREIEPGYRSMTDTHANLSSPAWSALGDHHAAIADVQMRDLFAADPWRCERLSLEACGLFMDYSKHRITNRTLEKLQALAAEAALSEWIERLFAGEDINVTEGRPVLHPALRHLEDSPFPANDRNVMPAVLEVRAKMREFCARVHSGRWRGVTERAVDTVVHIGIGGSHLGPAMACAALQPFGEAKTRVHFVSDLESAALARVLDRCDPEQTLFIVASKTFTTEETLSNAASARRWLRDRLGDEAAVAARHFVAITANPSRALAFGVARENVLEFWDWVGGRYSLWSAVGLPVALQIGMDGFEELLAGASQMDEHFRNAPHGENMPVLMGLLEVWYRNLFGATTRAVLPYDHALRLFPDYLRQLEMESNGKRVGRNGEPLSRATAPVVWGAPGIDGQHAFFQLLHQGGDLIPSDFIVPLESQHPLEGHHPAVLANALAQMRVLMRGRTTAEVEAPLAAQGLDAREVARRSAHQVLPGNQPSTALLYERLDARTLGALIALYEHKVFVESVIWKINAFDQWGVELGKSVARDARLGVADALDKGKAAGDTLTGRARRLLDACPPGDE
jgi:glucose-6-phosphate isomerase